MPPFAIVDGSAPTQVRYDELIVGDVFLLDGNAYTRKPVDASLCEFGNAVGSTVSFPPETIVIRTKSVNNYNN